MFTVYYSIFALSAMHHQKDLAPSAALVSVLLMFSNLATFVASSVWGWAADVLGRRVDGHSRTIALVIAPTYLLTNGYLILAIGFAVQGLFGGGDIRTERELPVRALPDRSTRDSSWLLCHQSASSSASSSLYCLDWRRRAKSWCPIFIFAYEPGG